MNELFDRIENEVLPDIETALGHKAFIAVREDGMLQFRIVAEENLDVTKGEGEWREWIRGRLLAADAPCVKVSPIVSPICPDKFSIYAVTVLTPACCPQRNYADIFCPRNGSSIKHKKGKNQC